MISKIGGETLDPVRAARKGCATIAEFDFEPFGGVAHALLQAVMPPILDGFQQRQASGQDIPSSVLYYVGGLSLQRQGAGAEQEQGRSGQFHQGFGAFLQPRHGSLQPFLFGPGASGTADFLFDERSAEFGQPGSVLVRR